MDAKLGAWLGESLSCLRFQVSVTCRKGTYRNAHEQHIYKDDATLYERIAPYIHDRGNLGGIARVGKGGAEVVHTLQWDKSAVAHHDFNSI